MAGYTKLFSSIIASTVWREDDKTRILWITMLAMSDRHGRIEASIPGLADFARITVAETERALEKLSGPDTYSRSQVEDGRRLRVIPGGWELINFGVYREKLSLEERREYNRIKKAEERKKMLTVSNVSNVNDKSALSAHSRDQTAAPDSSTRQQPQNGVIEKPVLKLEAPDVDRENCSPDGELFDEFWKAYPRKVGKDKARAAWKRRKFKRKDLAMILDALERQKGSADWIKNGGEFIPYPTTWLNGGRWQDEPTTALVPSGNASPWSEKAQRNLEASRRVMEKWGLVDDKK